MYFDGSDFEGGNQQELRWSKAVLFEKYNQNKCQFRALSTVQGLINFLSVMGRLKNLFLFLLEDKFTLWETKTMFIV